MKGRGNQKKTNPTGGKGWGGRKTFIDEIVSKAESSQRLSSRKSKLQQSPQSDYKTEEVVGPENIEEPAVSAGESEESASKSAEYIEEIVESVGRPVENVEEPIEDSDDRASAVGEPTMEGDNEGLFGGRRVELEGERRDENSLSTLGFPISDLPAGTMKNIPLSALPNFHGLSTEDLDEFLFEFDILCRSYDYVTNAQKLKLFPAILKGNALRWFMSLGSRVITTWEQMKRKFLLKYQDYCRTKEKKDELFNMAQKSDESLEDYIERLQYNIQRSDHPDISKEIGKTILLRGLRDDCLNMLNMLAKGDISKESYDEICELAKRCSRGAARNRTRDSTYSRVQKSANGGATRAEIGNLLEEFKTEMLSSFASQIDTL